MEVVLLDIGKYTGEVNEDGRPHGKGSLSYNEDDAMGRHKYDGGWSEGLQSGEGVMTFKSGDTYQGQFKENLPDGNGEFIYINGDKEIALWEKGQRHGLSRYTSAVDKTEEELMFWEGIADGPAKLTNLEDGSVEERLFSNGQKNGPAIIKFPNGDTFEFNYKDGEMEGKAIHTSSNGSEECIYKNGLRQGPSIDKRENGDVEERSYTNGVLEGKAVLLGGNGDKLEFTYRQGKRYGPAKYIWADGSVEVSIYDQDGVQNGPAKLTWPNGAVREGNKLNGKWNGDVYYTFADGPRKGKRDLEKWTDGEMVSSKKYYGKDEAFEVIDWEDLEKMEHCCENSVTK